jgi:hypothetical protein
MAAARSSKSELTLVPDLLTSGVGEVLDIHLWLLGSVEEGVLVVSIDDFLLDGAVGLGFGLWGGFCTLGLGVEELVFVFEGLGLELLLVFVDDLLLGGGYRVECQCMVDIGGDRRFKGRRYLNCNTY